MFIYILHLPLQKERLGNIQLYITLYTFCIPPHACSSKPQNYVMTFYCCNIFTALFEATLFSNIWNCATEQFAINIIRKLVVEKIFSVYLDVGQLNIIDGSQYRWCHQRGWAMKRYVIINFLPMFVKPSLDRKSCK